METKKRQKKGYESSEPFWPRFKRRIKKHDGKSKAFPDYSVEISPSAGKPKALVRVLSVSKRGDVIPLKIVSPIEAEVVSVKSQKSQVKEEPVPTRSHRSWVRVVVRAFRSSTSQNGKVRQVPSNETSLEVPPKIRTTRKAQRNTRKDSTAGSVAQQISEIVQNNPVEQQISEVTENNPVQKHVPEAIQRNPEADRKKKGGADRNPQSKLKAAASAPCSPMKSHRPTASMASTSYTHLPPVHISTIDIHNSGTTSKSSSKTVIDSEILPTVELEVYDVAIGFCPLIVVMLCLIFSDKFVAVLCTCVWWYAVAVLRNMSRFKEKAPSSKNSRQITKSLSHNYIDLQSSEYRKRVIMEGLLQRNNNMKR